MDAQLAKHYNNFFNELSSFFEIKLPKKPEVIFVKNRADINKLQGRKTPSWAVGWVQNEKIYLLDKKNYEKESCHKYSEGEYLSLLKHELTHIFFFKLSKENTNPIWLDEGVCIYLSGQNNFKKKPQVFKEFLNFHGKQEGVYRESGFIVQFLVEKYGKDKLLKLIKSLKNLNSWGEFNKKFEEIYNFKPTYSNFNSKI